MGRIEGKVAVITGGASGIGEAAVRLFLEEGARVVIGDIQDEKGHRLAEELGAGAIYQHTDVSRETDIRSTVEQAVSSFGRLDCILNNAGMAGYSGPIEETPVEAFDRTLAVHLRGVFLGIKHAAPIMKRQGFGSIVNMGSVAGLHTGHGPHAYSTAKAAIIHLTRSVAVELGESGVRVNCICPGGIMTSIFGVAFGLPTEEADRTVGLLEEPLSQLQPLRRAGRPRDIAQAALWLASDDSSFVNGHALVVDGGLTCGKGWTEASESFANLASALGLGNASRPE